MKLRNIFTVIAALATVTACDDFLDPKSLSTFDTNYVFSNVEDARKTVSGIYTHFSQDAFTSRLSNNMAGNTDIEHSGGWNGSGARYEIWDLNATSANADLSILWTFAYRAIRDANICIEGIKASSALNSSNAATSREMYHLLGEAYTLRAYWYSMLIYYFGDVPFIKDAPKAGNDFSLPKEDRNVILSAVIQDMIDIEEKMMWADQVTYGIEQVNREYTLGMIARLALQRGGYYLKPDMTMAREGDYLDYYQIARTYTAKLMSLKDRALTDFKTVFMNQNKFISPTNSDILFEIPFSLGRGDVGWNIGITVVAGNHNYGGGNNYMAIPPTYFYSFDTLDVRRDVTCALYRVNKDFQEEFVGMGGAATDYTNISQGKWSRYFLDTPPGPSTAKGTGINWPMLRYADVILMFAEAENEINGPTGEAQSALKRVRQRAFPSSAWPAQVDAYVASVSGGKDAFFKAIVNERAWEFGGEMIRKYELIRWGIYSDKMNETVQGLKAMADRAYAIDQGAAVTTSDRPHYIFWKRNASGKFTVLNVNKAIPNSQHAALEAAGWTKTSFLLSMHDNTLTYKEWITRDWAKYTNGTVRYIFPIPAAEIATGVLSNDGYGFGG
ncbi:RagB/SusD family nutrient uptake outer membrane protein [Fulvivirgaceae bacterium PWU4]|uniref:RagB/SusD family nutrient uptake outer membrane protein n=1 Tax=Chryseosolibacter histidini TaxID=2782349 RepID=A0AAP2DI91_9BACT|nr:RagB/SusD family nutrient uptake outer membrane protein [Chryseosolibacter histidini]MBT1695702.1 RagB/SusD family nutrient uptake outer membrane protein [Chryseosolibacter histidini]